MKKLTLVALAAALVAAMFLSPAAPPATAGVGVCDAQQSRLCWALMEWWKMDDAADAQYGSQANTPIYEPDGYDVAVSGVSRSPHGSGLDFTGSTGSYLWSPRWGNLPSYWTIAFWVYPQKTSAYQYLVGSFSPAPSNKGGTYIRTDTSNPPKIQIVVNVDETDSSVSATSASGISLNSWHLVVAKVSPYGPYGGAQGCISIDGGSFTCSTLTYNVKPSLGDLWVGAHVASATWYYDGLMDSLGIWARAWDDADVTAFYNSGTGIVFPFY